MMSFRFKLPMIAPLLLNGYALVLNAGMTALLGIVFWMVATRLYTQEQVGLAAALISAMTTISYFCQMNLSSYLTRFLPGAGTGAGRLIVQAYALAGLVSALVAVVFATGVGSVAEPLEILGGNAGLMAVFVAATVLWSIFALQDAVLSGLRRATLVPTSNTVYAVVKIGLLLVVSGFALSSPQGIFFAWIVPLLPIVVVVNALIYRGLPHTRHGGGERRLDLRSASRFWGWDFLGSLALGAAFGLAPLMITAAAGVAATASYHLAWSFTYSIYLIGRAMSTSLVAEGATDPIRLRRLIADSLGHALLLISGGVAFILVFAPQIMGLFGPGYVQDGAPVLRLLALSCLPWAVTTIYCAAARVRRQTRAVAVLQIGTLFLFAAVSAPLVGGYGAQGVAIGWLVAHTTVCLGIVLRVLWTEGWIGLEHWMLSLTGSGLRLANSLLRPAFGTQGRHAALPPEVSVGLSQSSLRGMTVEQVKGGVTDVAVFVLRHETEAEARAVLKIAASEKGIAALRRNAQALRSQAADPRVGFHIDLLPRLLLEECWGHWLCTAETAVPGIEGRKVRKSGKGWAAALTAAAAILADMHRRTATRCRLDERWARDWIDKPVDTLLQDRGDRAVALAQLKAELRDIYVGREVALGLGHGDVWPGNLFLMARPTGGDRLALSGLVDWDTYRSDAPAAVDVCQLGLSLRMERSGEELGPVVRTLLLRGHWTEEEQAIFAAAGLQDEFGQANDPAMQRGILLLTWVRHVAMVIGQSERRAAHGYWARVNVDLVLKTLRHQRRISPP
jgi:O-antigen/teichoic acid export membrane protein